MGKKLVIGQGGRNFCAWIAIHRTLHGCMAITKHLIILKKDDCCTNNVSSSKRGIYNCFGPMICFQNSNVLSTLKIVLKICVQFQITPKTRGQITPIGAPPNSLKDSNVSPKVKITNEKMIGAHSLVCNTFGVRRHVKGLGCELGRMTSVSIIHISGYL